MNDVKELRAILDRLKRNETQMTKEQLLEYAPQLDALHKKATALAIKIGREFLFMGVRYKDEDATFCRDMVRSVFDDKDIKDAEEAGLSILFSTYSLDKYLTSLIPLQNRIWYKGYARYWISHCVPVKNSDSETEFTFYNDLIGMFWSPDWKLWKTKDKWAVTIMLPPTMALINEEYEKELIRLREGGSDGTS